MKKSILMAILIALITVPAFADGKNVTSHVLTTGGTSISSYAVTSLNDVTTDGILNKGNVGFAALIIETDVSMSISQQVSNDNTTFYSPNTTDGTDLTTADTVVSNMTAADRWIILTARMGKYVRFVITPIGNGTITLTYTWQEEY